MNNNPGITVKDIEKHPEIQWNFNLLSSNPNITWDFIRRHPGYLVESDINEIKEMFKQGNKYDDIIDLHWNIVKPDIQLIVNNYNTGKDILIMFNLYQVYVKFIESIYKRGSISYIKKKWDLIQNYIKKQIIDKKSWNYEVLSKYNPYITPKIVSENQDKLIISELNPNITPEFVKNNSQIKWDWSLLARNPNFKYNDLIEHFDNIVEFIKNFSYNPNMSELVENLDDWVKVWEDEEEKFDIWERITINPGISISNISDNPQLPWNIKSIWKNPNITLKTFIYNENIILLDIDGLLNNHLQMNRYAKHRKNVKFDKFYMITNFLYQYILSDKKEVKEVSGVSKKLFNDVNDMVNTIVNTNEIPTAIEQLNNKLKTNNSYDILGIISYHLALIIEYYIYLNINADMSVAFNIQTTLLNKFSEIYKYLNGRIINTKELSKDKCINKTELIYHLDEINDLELNKLISFELNDRVYCLLRENLLAFWEQETDNHGESNAFNFGDCKFEIDEFGEYSINQAGYRIAIEDTCKKFYKIPLMLDELPITIRISETDKNMIISNFHVNYWKIIRYKMVRMGREFHYYGENNEDEQVYKVKPIYV